MEAKAEIASADLKLSRGANPQSLSKPNGKSCKNERPNSPAVIRKACPAFVIVRSSALLSFVLQLAFERLRGHCDRSTLGRRSAAMQIHRVWAARQVNLTDALSCKRRRSSNLLDRRRFAFASHDAAALCGHVRSLASWRTFPLRNNPAILRYIKAAGTARRRLFLDISLTCGESK
jgi:hypothetical protein